MDPKILWTIVAIVTVAVAVAIGLLMRKRRTERLRQRFGPEYTHTVARVGDVTRAEADLDARTKRVEHLHIHALTSADAARFAAAWRNVQSEFVDQPAAAVTKADRLVGEVMHARGYPVGDFDQREADLSVDHADVVINYRAAQEIAHRHARGEASTEDLRQAMVHYRSLFDDLLAIQPESTAAATAAREHELARRR